MRFYGFIGSAILMLLANVALGQPKDTVSMVTINGNIIDLATKEAVNAKIHYESLPYSSKIGIFSGNTFVLKMEGGNDYALRITAEGYAIHTETLKHSDLLSGEHNKTVELRPTGINQVIRLDKLIFGQGKADISQISFDELDELVNMMNANINMLIQLEGHTDFRGNAKKNMQLSEARVGAVRDYLASKGIDKKRIKTKAFGGTEPLSRGDDAEARRGNRRVEVRILQN